MDSWIFTLWVIIQCYVTLVLKLFQLQPLGACSVCSCAFSPIPIVLLFEDQLLFFFFNREGQISEFLYRTRNQVDSSLTLSKYRVLIILQLIQRFKTDLIYSVIHLLDKLRMLRVCQKFGTRLVSLSHSQATTGINSG